MARCKLAMGCGALVNGRTFDDAVNSQSLPIYSWVILLQSLRRAYYEPSAMSPAPRRRSGSSLAALGGPTPCTSTSSTSWSYRATRLLCCGPHYHRDCESVALGGDIAVVSGDVAWEIYSSYSLSLRSMITFSTLVANRHSNRRVLGCSTATAPYTKTITWRCTAHGPHKS
jgi:hypothetical protein